MSIKHRKTEAALSSKSNKETEQALQLLWKESGVKDYVLKYNLTTKERISRAPSKGKSSTQTVYSDREEATKGTTAGKFCKVDKEATYEAIQSTWINRAKRDVVSVCETINQLLDHPIMSSEDQKAVILIQKCVRGWLLRTRRARGELFPVEEQAMADSRVMLSIYGAKVFSLAPRERRMLVVEHFASRKIVRALRKFCAAISKRNKCSSAEISAAIKIQKTLRGHWSRKFVRLNKRHLTRATSFLEFRASEFTSISRDYLNRLFRCPPAPPRLTSCRLQALAACRLQTSIRRHSAVQTIDKERRRRAAAITILQSQTRAHIARSSYDKTLCNQLTRRILRHWNKIMWTMCSPERYLVREAKRMGKAAVDDSMIATCMGEVRRSLWLNDSVDQSLVNDQPNQLLSACGLQVVEVTADAHRADDVSVRTSWKILPTQDDEEIILGGKGEEEATAGSEQQQQQQQQQQQVSRSPRLVCDIEKDYDEAQVCMDTSVFFEAILAERKAIILQSSYRCHQARARKRLWQQERGAAAARSSSLVYRSSSSPNRSQVDSSQLEVSSPIMRSPSSRSPTNRGLSRAQSREVLAEWKKGIEEKVSTIHEQLTDSARKRFLSKSPPASRMDVETALLLSPDNKGGGQHVLLMSPQAAPKKLMSLPHLPSPPH
ncbi:hypothetical protein GUITHDRAFT_107347 [Guillardia theta CCMP2712]|uniref:Uncharacterized protein n=1 Tax=Guillardia theta (strain CCMP2712) TaxID=905079 RepID=L1JFX8_GUITC|nr:hypothetical protein GUITHDRAFT_107347 [Guillardia theta CCMP2712]EKX47000.1 hypothetical protein GUITHDRAFT_107347 [Guillardia theta CCMP2712]|eukprot:XP_005833980.1 hypothetical protein GUITHDRAFT_107347 [Guillardia theta CCMP2712]